MAEKNSKEGMLVALFDGGKEQQGGSLTGPEIAIAYKAALSDFVCRKTSRAAIAEVSRLLFGALAARRQELSELDGTSSQRIGNYY